MNMNCKKRFQKTKNPALCLEDAGFQIDKD